MGGKIVCIVVIVCIILYYSQKRIRLKKATRPDVWREGKTTTKSNAGIGITKQRVLPRWDALCFWYGLVYFVYNNMDYLLESDAMQCNAI